VETERRSDAADARAAAASGGSANGSNGAGHDRQNVRASAVPS
jgi:hypothetical protein